MAKTRLWARVGWRAFAKAISGLGHLMDADELALYQRHTRRERPPTQPVDEAAMMIGTSAGKTDFAAFKATHAAITFPPELAVDGELVTIPIVAKDRAQARMAFGYVKGYCRLPEVRPFVHRELDDVIELRTGVNIEITTATFRGVRGYTCPAAVLDEVAFWLDEGSNPDAEIVNAIRTRLSRVPGSQLLILSSPHAPRGVLHEMHEVYWGKTEDSERDRVVFWNASTLAMRPDHPKPHAIERAFRLDPASALAEYGGVDGFVQFRQHQQALFDLEPVNAAIVKGRAELLPQAGTRYIGFLDAAEGSRNGDSMALGIAHAEGAHGVLDVLRVSDPPFQPADVITNTFAPLLHAYGITKVSGDRHAIGFVSEALRACGITFEPTTLSKSDIYIELLSLLNSGGAQLLDNSTLRTQLLALQRRSVRGGRDSVDHPAGGHDDGSNAASGAVVLASGVGVKRKKPIMFSGMTRDEPRDVHAELRRLAEQTIAGLEAQDRLDRAREKAAEQPVWFRVTGTS
jgi:hypothetical protein